MRNLKRALSLTLASVMLLGMMVVGTSAASFPDVDDSDNVEAIEVAKAVGVMIGDDRGNFNPNAAVTRNEMAVIMAKLLLGTYEADSYVGTHPFTDVPQWADRYVAACYASGIVAGRSATIYDGTATVTAIEAAAMMLRALGYEDLSKNADRWDQPVAAKANEINLFEGLTGNGNAAMDRNSVAKLTLNTIQATMVTTVRDGQDIQIGDVTISSNIRYVERDDKSNTYKNEIKDDDYLQLGEYLYKGKLAVDDEPDDYGMPATVWTYDGKEVISSPKAAEHVWTTGIEDITLDDLYKALGSKTGALAIYENGVQNGTVDPTRGATADGDKALKNYKGATIYAVDKKENGGAGTDPDGIVDSLIVVYPYLAKVTKVTAATSTADRKITMDVWSKTDGSKITGVTYETEDFEKDDYVLVFPGDKMSATGTWTNTQMSSDILDVKPVETAVGKISAVSGTQGNVTALTIDGTKYTVGGDNLATKGLNNGQTVKASSYSFTSETTLYLSNGYVLGTEGTNGAKDISNIVYATAKYKPVGDYGVTNTWYVQVIRMDGTVENLKADGDPGIASAGFYSISETDGKYTFTVAKAYNLIDGDEVFFGTTTTGAEYTMKADDKTVSVTGATRAYLTENTRILYVKDDLDDLKTSMVTGPVRQVVGAGSKVLLSQDGSSYVVEAIIINGEKASASDEVVYVSGNAKDILADSAKNYEYWDANTGEKHTVPVKNSNAPSTGFATYSVDNDGYYKFTPVTTTTTKNADGAHAITHAITLYGNLLTEGTTLEDADASDATYINQTGDKAYDSLSLKDITDATDLAGVVYVVDEKVVAIVVTTYAESGSRAVWTSNVITASNQSSTAATNQLNIGGKTVDVTPSGGTAKTINDVKTALEGSSGFNGGTWNITITNDGKDLTFTAQAAGALDSAGAPGTGDAAGMDQVDEGKDKIAAHATVNIAAGGGSTASICGETIDLTSSPSGDGTGNFKYSATGDDANGWVVTVESTATDPTADVTIGGVSFTGGAAAVKAVYKVADVADKIAEATTTVNKLTVGGKQYTVTGTTLAEQIASWVDSYNNDGGFTAYTAKVGAGDTVVLTAKAIGEKNDSGASAITTPGDGTFRDGSNA